MDRGHMEPGSRLHPGLAGCGGPGPHGGCYAEGIAARFSGAGMAYEGLAEMRGGKPRWTGKLSFGHDLDAPLRWRRAQRIFVNSMSDLFHEGLAVHEIATVYAVCVAAHHLRGHVFQILTKRSARMREVLASEEFWDQVNAEAGMHVMERTDALSRRSDDARATLGEYGPDAPPPGIWLGVSAEDQRRADERVPDLLATPAAIRFVSAEPLLGPIDFLSIEWPGLKGHRVDVLRNGFWTEPGAHPLSAKAAGAGEPKGWFTNHSDMPGRLDWIIVGGESGPNARPMHPAWARSIRDQCAAAGAAYLFKQWGAWSPGGDHLEEDRPEFLRLRRCDRTHIFPDHQTMVLVGKKAAGRRLDGVEHNGMPEVTATTHGEVAKAPSPCRLSQRSEKRARAVCCARPKYCSPFSTT